MRWLASVIVAIGLVACEQRRIVEIDLPVGDQCWFIVEHRPLNCAQLPQNCIYSDGTFALERKGDDLMLSASAGSHLQPNQTVATTPDIRVSSPARAAESLQNALAALDAPPEAIEHPCVYIRPDMELNFGDVLDFRDALLARGARRVELYAEIGVLKTWRATKIVMAP
jgi:hypothetical protein